MDLIDALQAFRMVAEESSFTRGRTGAACRSRW